MSIVERAADLLGLTPQTQHKPAAAGEGTDTQDLGLIERANRNRSERPDVSAAPGQTRETVLKEISPVDTGRVSRAISVDLAKLREQRVITPDDARTPIAESFRRIKRHILANLTNPKVASRANLVMLTSPLPGEGKTFCTINLAISLAMEMDRSVLLVDADVAKPSIMSVLGIKGTAEQGLMDILLDRKVGLTDTLCKTDIGKLTVLPAGTPHARATEVLASERMRVLLQEMAERYSDRIIIFDSPPLLAASEASVLASEMGQIVLVVEAGRTTETALKDALSRIESSNVVGVLLNKGAPPGSGYYGDYGYGYGYGS
jgi:protein-tyrosine kinase